MSCTAPVALATLRLRWRRRMMWTVAITITRMAAIGTAIARTNLVLGEIEVEGAMCPVVDEMEGAVAA